MDETLGGVGFFSQRHFTRLPEEVAEAEQSLVLVPGRGLDDQSTTPSDLDGDHISGHSVYLATYAEDAGRRHGHVVRPHYLEVV